MTAALATVPTYEPPELEQARAICASRLVPASFREYPGDVLVAKDMAHHLGVALVFVLQNLCFIGGQACFKAQFAIAMANRAKVFRGPIRWEEAGEGDGLSVTAYAESALDGQRVEATVSMATAKAEGWTRNAKYKTMPAQMLRWRAAAWLVRMTAPEVMFGLYTVDELEDVDAARGRSDVTPEPRGQLVAVAVANPSPPSPPAPAQGGAAPAVSGGGQVEAQAQPQAEAPKRATQAQGRAWRERLAAWREAAELEPLDPEVVADLCEALGNGRPSTLPLEKQEQLLGWLDYPEGKGMARYRAIAAQRAEALAAARSLSVADRKRAAERAGVGTEPAKLTLIELQRLAQAALELGIGVDGDGTAEGEHAEEELDAWTDPGTPEGDALEMAIGDCELATTEDEQRQAAEAAGLRWMADAGAVTEGVPEPQLRRYLAALRARVSP